MDNKLFFRFLKEKGAYNEFLNELKNRDEFYRVEIAKKYIFKYNSIDELLGWAKTKNGFNYWYYLQIDLILLCIAETPTRDNVDYCISLLKGYGNTTSTHSCGEFYDRLKQSYKLLTSLSSTYDLDKKEMRKLMEKYFSKEFEKNLFI